MATMGAFWEKASIYLNLPKITMTDVVEILIITFLFYYMLVWIKNTRAWVLLKGIMVILLFVLVAAVFQMNTIIWIAKNTLSVAITAIVIIFQPEIRKALENLGQKNFLTSFFTFDFSKGEIAKFTDKTINELVKACYEMGKVKTGALIVIEDEIVLSEYERTGIAVDGILTSQLLINIFEKNTPLHDGAVIVRGDRVVSATCYLPLTDSLSISKDHLPGIFLIMLQHGKYIPAVFQLLCDGGNKTVQLSLDLLSFFPYQLFCFSCLLIVDHDS